MRPIDMRNLTWRTVLTHVTADMLRVHQAWLEQGPGTTRAVAQRAGISLLTFRPRTTDLYNLGLVALTGADGGEGVYAFVSPAAAESSAAWRDRADFRRGKKDAPGREPVGFITVEAAVSSLEPAAQAALGAKLMGRWGHLLKKREAGGASQTHLALA